MLFLKVAALRKMHLSPFSHQVKVFLGLLQFTYVNVLQASGDAFFLFQFVWEQTVPCIVPVGKAVPGTYHKHWLIESS